MFETDRPRSGHRIAWGGFGPLAFGGPSRDAANAMVIVADHLNLVGTRAVPLRHECSMRTPLTFADRLIKAHQRRSPRATSGLAFACVAALPLSAWGVVEGLRGSYSTWVDARFHPQVPGYPSAVWSNATPDYPYDASAIAICGLLFCGAATTLLLLALAALLAQRRDRLTPPTR